MNTIYTNFEVSDYINGIVSATIGLTPNSVGTIITSGIQSLDGEYKFLVPVQISATGYVEISATNYVNQTSTIRENNFIIGCEKGRKVNLTNFLPINYRDKFDGSSSELYQFVELFQNYLNTLYVSTDDSCNLSTLEKIKKLQEFRNIDKIDSEYMYQYANMLGYDIGINKSQIGTFSSSTGNYSDTFEQYQDKCLRFILGDIPNWYSIKTTRNAVKIMLLSYGMIGDIVENYTLDYNLFWKQNKVRYDQYVSNDISKEWYPTPHISVGIDLNNTPYENAYSDSIKNIISSMESIRPANVVIDSLQGIIYQDQSNTTRSINLSMSFKSSKTINVTKSAQINIT